MKTLKISLLTLAVAFFLFTGTSAQATEVSTSDIQYMENGDYIETTIVILSSSRAASTCSGKKTATYRNSSGTAMWSVTVHATFSYTPGKSSKCTSASGSSSCNSSSWTVSSATSSKSGNTATATATGTQYRNSKPVGSYTRSVTLTCDTNGNLS